MEETEVSFEWDSAAELVAMVQDTVPPLVAMIERNAPDNPDAAWNAILEAVEERASDDGTVKFSNLVLLAAGRAYIIGGRDRPLLDLRKPLEVASVARVGTARVSGRT